MLGITENYTRTHARTHAHTHTHTHTHTFNGPFSRTTWVGRYQKIKTNLDFTEARDSEWQWHQLGPVAYLGGGGHWAMAPPPFGLNTKIF